MKTRFGFGKFATIAAMVLGIMTVPAMAAESGNVDDHGHGVTELSLNNGAKWTIDEPLSRAMNNIRDVMAEEIEALHANELDGEEYIALSEQINAEVTYMIENCKLEPEADAQLHIIIHDLLGGTTAMSDQTNAKKGAITVVEALDDYSTYFDDPNFEPITN